MFFSWWSKKSTYPLFVAKKAKTSGEEPPEAGVIDR